MADPTVAVLMPFRNAAAFIEEAVRSVLAQTWRDFELIAVDDGSTDDSLSIVTALADQDRRVRVLANTGEGIADALETARGRTKAPFLARMDADDIAAPDRLERQMRFLEEHPEVVAVGGDVVLIDADGNVARRMDYPKGDEACRRFLTRGSPLCHPAVTLRAEAVARVGGYRAAFEPAEDYDLWLRLTQIGAIDNLDTVVLAYRRHPESTTARRGVDQSVAAARAYLSRLHAELGAALSAVPQVEKAADWAAFEAGLPEDVQAIARRTFLRATALNGTAANPDCTEMLLDSIAALPDEARGAQAREDIGYWLCRAGWQLARRRPVAALRIAWCLLQHFPGPAFRAVRAALARKYARP